MEQREATEFKTSTHKLVIQVILTSFRSLLGRNLFLIIQHEIK